MKRREFITLLGGVYAGWPFAAGAQRPEPMRRIGALMNLAADDPENQDRVGAVLQQLAKLGWPIGHNLQIDYRWPAGDDAVPCKTESRSTIRQAPMGRGASW
jgi:putative ABC transport system substrate-binding protein